MIKEEGEFTHFYDDPKNKTLVLYRIKDKAPRRVEVPYQTEYPFAVAQFKNDLYFTGGGRMTESHGELFMKTAMVVKVKPKDMDTPAEKLAEMIMARTKHSMAIVNGTHLYAVGGLNSIGIITNCEEYEIDKNEWKACASLNEKRMRVSLIAIDPKYLYAFGGEKGKDLNGTKIIECLNTSNKGAKSWTLVALSSGAEVWPEICLSGTFQLTTEDIMIFGGCVGKAEVNSTFIFSIPSKSMRRSENLAYKDIFLMTRPVVYGNDLTVLGKNEGHRYNLLDKKWSLLKKETLTPIAGFFIKADTV
eukprot:TRINITY_DN13156_c0_g2_i2.p1 TRINITY_DN13156_c0_g2~~TRINITY_DN13156_c0_g2_i2.p1  ORF type:complete len:304 (-),score=60.63 TRINITY_DN13156_c0_g2_i2:155-1066(-)